MNVKSMLFALALVFSVSGVFANDNPVTPNSEQAVHEAIVEYSPASTAATLVAEEDRCTLNATFESGGQTVEVTVTADDCASAAETLTAIAEVLDQQ